jgi:hypothetical protein
LNLNSKVKTIESGFGVKDRGLKKSEKKSKLLRLNLKRLGEW